MLPEVLCWQGHRAHGDVWAAVSMAGARAAMTGGPAGAVTEGGGGGGDDDGVITAGGGCGGGGGGGVWRLSVARGIVLAGAPCPL